MEENKLEITDGEGHRIDIIDSLPDDMQEWDIHGSIPKALVGDRFQALFQEFQGTGFSAWYNRYWTKLPTILRARANFPMLEFRIALVNRLRGTWEKVTEPSLRAGQFNLCFTPHVETRAVFDGKSYYATFDVHAGPALLADLGIGYRKLEQFLKKVGREQPAELSAYPHDAPAAMMDCIQFILRNSYSVKAQPRLLEWNIKQILLIALETVASPDRPLPLMLTAREIEGLHAVRQYITDSFPDWPDHAILCRKGEINEFKLKAGFKHLFRVTAHEYHMQLKFAQAKQMLLETTDSISDIAYKLGYDHHPSFTYEFKKQFGYTPSWFQKHGRQ